MKSILLLGLVILSCTAPASAQPRGGIPVAFNSKDRSGAAIGIPGVLYRPGVAPAKGAVVLVHGSGGWTDSREGDYGRAFSAAGFAVLAIDSFGARGVGGTAEDQTLVTATLMTIDAFNARRFLIEIGFDPERIGVMGFSKGGQVALHAADRTFVPQETDRFRAAIPFYPGCNSRPRQPKPASAVFMALGEKDNWTGVKPCQDIADDFAAAGGRITVKVYPDATHGFDGSPEFTRAFRLPFIENYIDCVADIEPNGDMVYGGSRYPAGDIRIYEALRKTCMKKGTLMWTNLEQKERATQDVIAFLNDVMK